MLDYSDGSTEPRRSLLKIEDRNELAWNILDFGLMDDPDLADLVDRAAGGRGEHCMLLRAMISHPDEPIIAPVALPPPPQPYRFPPIGPREQMKALKANPFMMSTDMLPPPLAVQRATSSMSSPRPRSAVLTDEAARLYRSLAFAMHEYGVVMNGHMTVTWEEWGIRNHADATAMLTEFNARMGKWLGVDATGRKRKGVASAAYGVGEQYFYAFIHEHASNRGFHTHQLFRVGDGKAKAFAERAMKVLQRLTGVATVPANGVVFTPGTVREGFAPYLPRFKRNEAPRCWNWFRYLAKNLSPHEFMRVGDQCASQRNVFRIRKPFVPPMPVTCSDLFGCSQNIGIGAQRKADFVSKLDTGDWKNLYSSSELDEYERRCRECERQQEMDDILAGIEI
jgi:hypothetical protein